MLFFVLAVSSYAGPVYVGGSAGEFKTLDLTTSNFASIGHTQPVFVGMGFSGGTLFGLDNSNPSKLFEIAVADAAITSIGSNNLHEGVGATTDPTGLFWAIDTFSGELFTVNPLRGIATDIGQYGSRF